MYPTGIEGNISDLNENSELIVSLPTRLDSDYWESQFEQEESSSVEYDTFEDSGVESGINQLNLTVDNVDSLEVNTVGIGEEPTGDSATNTRLRNGGEDEINPAAPGDVQLVGAEWDNGGDNVELKFRNSGDDSSFTDGRINFYTGGGNNPTEVQNVNVVVNPNPRGENWLIGDNFKELSPDIFLEGGGSTTTIELDFDQGVEKNNDFFVVTFILENEQQATYFVGGTFSFEEDDGSGDDGTGGGGDTEGDPEFEVLSAMVTDYQNGQDLIQEVEIDGTIQNSDSAGTIEFEVTGDDDTQQDDSPRQIDMVSDFDSQTFTTGTGSNGQEEVNIIVRLLDSGGDVYVTCEGEEPLDSDGDSLTIANDDFECN